MKALSTEKTRHLILRADAGEMLPGDLARELRDQAVTCGWYRASGVLEEVDLRAYDAGLPGPGAARRVVGPVQVIALEGSVGLAGGDVSFGMRAILARETDRGMETLAGEIVSARVVALEVLVSAFDDLAVGRSVDPAARVWILGGDGSSPAAAAPGVSPRKAPPPPQSQPSPSPGPRWNETVTASEAAQPPRVAPKPPVATGPGSAMPARIVRPDRPQEEDGIVPEAGDLVDHFAFGRCEVLKSDGDRLHLKVGKDSRIREIALEMLRVTPIENEGAQRIFRLDRRL